jgi:hypothetical protein
MGYSAIIKAGIARVWKIYPFNSLIHHRKVRRGDEEGKGKGGGGGGDE